MKKPFKDKRNFKRSSPEYALYRKMCEKTNGRPEEYIAENEKELKLLAKYET